MVIAARTMVVVDNVVAVVVVVSTIAFRTGHKKRDDTASRSHVAIRAAGLPYNISSKKITRIDYRD